MAKVNTLLTQRLKKATEKFSNKMTALAELTSSGSRSSFSGVFRVTPLPAKEHEELQNILSEYKFEGANIKDDLHQLTTLTTEVKAINNQAAILHGERIKKAQSILKKYKDGAFSAWLIAAYGNRQTPYNFLQYYELYHSLPQMLVPKLEEMPKQAVYTLASRIGPADKKEQIVKNYRGEPKGALLALIRETFPLSKEDRRAQDMAELALGSLTRAHKLFDHPQFRPTVEQKKKLENLLSSLLSMIQ